MKILSFILVAFIFVNCNQTTGNSKIFPIKIHNGDDESLGISNFILEGEMTKELNSDTPDEKYNCEKCLNNWAFLKDNHDTFRIRRVYLSQLGWSDTESLETFSLQFKTTKVDTLPNSVFAFHCNTSVIITDRQNFVIFFRRYNSDHTVINFSEVYGNAPKDWETLSALYAVR